MAPSRNAVDAFFSAALKAGGRIHGEPAVRDQETGYYSAAIIDFDNNSIEVMHRNRIVQSTRIITGNFEDPQVLNWQKNIAKSTTGRVSQASPQITINNITTPTMVVSQPMPETKPKSEISSRAIIGTLLGAAAGAAVAYAMTKAEDDSVKPAEPRTITYHTIEAQDLPAAQSVMEYRQPYSQSVVSQVPRTVLREIEYPHPPSSVSGRSMKSHQTAVSVRTLGPRTLTAPAVHGTLIDTFVPPTEVPRYPLGSLARSNTDGQLQPPSSKALSVASMQSKPSKVSSVAKTIIPANFAAAQPSVVTEVKVARDLPLPHSRATSFLGGSHQHDAESVLGSVAPSDSVSQAGSKKSRASGRSKRHSSSKQMEGKMHEDGESRVSDRTTKAEGSKAGTKKDSVVSMPNRPSSKISVHRSILSFLEV